MPADDTLVMSDERIAELLKRAANFLLTADGSERITSAADTSALISMVTFAAPRPGVI